MGKEIVITSKDVARLSSLFRNLGIVRLKVLFYLYRTPYRKAKTVAHVLGYNYPAVKGSLLGLKMAGLVKKGKGGYTLTKHGKRLVELMIDLIEEEKNAT